MSLVTPCSVPACANHADCLRAVPAGNAPRVHLLVVGRGGKCVNYLPREVKS